MIEKDNAEVVALRETLRERTQQLNAVYNLLAVEKGLSIKSLSLVKFVSDNSELRLSKAIEIKDLSF